MTPALADTGDLGAYVRARAADADGNTAVAVAGYSAALAAAPDDAGIALRAYREALDAGDLPLARRARVVVEKAGNAPPDVALFAFADAVSGGDVAGQDVAVAGLGKGPLDFLAPVLRAWTALQRGKADPLVQLGGPAANPLAARYISEHRALLLIAVGRAEEGVAALRVLGSEAGFDIYYAAAQLLASAGKRDLGLALLAGDDALQVAARTALGKGVKPSLGFGASRLYTRLASDVSGSTPSPLTVVLARSALLLDGDNDRAKLLLANALAAEDAHDRALAELDLVPTKSPYAARAAEMRIDIAAASGQNDAALAAAREIAMAKGATVTAAVRYADRLLETGHYADAADAYALAISRNPGDAPWPLLFQRGAALDRAGRWAEAKPLLERAATLAPDQPMVLNYLAYAQVDRGENLKEATAMLARARQLKPEDPAIADSLAWAWYRQGQVKEALPLLEAAAKSQASSVAINEHLGDAYWALGRHYEARYAWRAAAIYAEGDEASRLAAKIARGGASATP